MADRVIERCCIILFVKSPEHGPVKSRLAQAVGDATAGSLYRNFVLDMLATLANVTADGRSDLRVCFYPPGAGGEIRNWLGDAYILMPQEGGDLGERMKNAFLACFTAGYNRAMVLGSDAPDLPESVISEALDGLSRHAAVIGPARDGGYYLLGFQAAAFFPEVFQGIPWSTERVFDLTMKILRCKQADVHVLPTWRDIDTLADLLVLRDACPNGRFLQSRTMRYLNSYYREERKNYK